MSGSRRETELIGGVNVAVVDPFGGHLGSISVAAAGS